MNSEELTTYLQKNNLLLVNKDALLDLMVEVNLKTKVDKRVKWLTQRDVIAKYGVTRHWLTLAEKNEKSPLKVKKGAYKTAKKKYNEQSVIDTQNWQYEISNC
ncbi:hypothetical protein BA195_06665 [Tenacibaculum soleae]|uniref:Uncharacterized protein n=1 Tax=Tenacibaculum soleae TaxID=447689 RepID=A0A1B9Y3H7_9FLAO|nr:hypothetical protein [Tenacibaculum soleae]OCK44353.1 hypothetical protein BA195_06665 [Tenacibaculum soleae]